MTRYTDTTAYELFCHGWITVSAHYSTRCRCGDWFIVEADDLPDAGWRQLDRDPDGRWRQIDPDDQCPRCGDTDVPLNGLSRSDNATQICGPCSTTEAMMVFAEMTDTAEVDPDKIRQLFEFDRMTWAHEVA